VSNWIIHGFCMTLLSAVEGLFLKWDQKPIKNGERLSIPELPRLKWAFIKNYHIK